MSTQATSQNLVGAGWVPGWPHLMRPDRNASYQELSQAAGALGQQLKDAGCERILYYSTQWLSVLGTSFQARPRLKGTHVDENWHDQPDLPFNFSVDPSFARDLAHQAKLEGFATQLIDYEGFPVDTGTIVAHNLLGLHDLPVNMVSCSVYLDYDATLKLGRAMRAAIDGDGKKTAVVVASLLSGNYFTHEIDLREDHIRKPSDDEWNRRWLQLLQQGKLDEARRWVPEYSRTCKGDMGMKAFAFLQGILGAEAQPVQVLAYGPLYGAGASVMRFA